MFKKGDKVRCIESGNDYTEGRIYTVVDANESDMGTCIIDNNGMNRWAHSNRFELVQEDKLPHELLGLPKYFVVKKDESDPFWELFCNWVSNNFSDSSDRRRWEYVGYDGNKINKGGIRAVNYNEWDNKYNEGTLITLAERDICVNKKKSQTKKLSKPTWSCTYMGETITGSSIEEVKNKFDQLGRELISKGNKFRYVK